LRGGTIGQQANGPRRRIDHGRQVRGIDVGDIVRGLVIVTVEIEAGQGVGDDASLSHA
jgi:hypothetical protein